MLVIYMNKSLDNKFDNVLGKILNSYEQTMKTVMNIKYRYKHTVKTDINIQWRQL